MAAIVAVIGPWRGHRVATASGGRSSQLAPRPAGPAPTPAPSPALAPTALTGTTTATPSTPPQFSPLSVTFVSLQTGWVLGTRPCPAGACTVIVRTRDGGHSWVTITTLAPAGATHLRFANLQDGWAYGSDLWATHDGGAHWRRVALSGVGHNALVAALETAGQSVHAAVIDTGVVRILTSPVSTDAWSASSTTVSTGAGPVPRPVLVLQGSAGWLIENDRTVVGGARLTNGQWIPWQPPCIDTGGPASLAAASPTDLVAVCDTGLWTGTSPDTETLASTDGGATFRRTASHLLRYPSVVASPAPGAVVIGGSTSDNALALDASTDSQQSWNPVFRQPAGGVWLELGFTSANQGVAIYRSPEGRGAFLMSVDGGRHWRALTFPVAS
jgi:photosystem II stability/assembly factor-like uncharacterized protein